MITKVKGDKIKEGSIPFSALDDISKVILEYNLRGYQGILTGDINTVMVSPYYKNTSIKNIYLYTKNKIFTLPLNGSVTITGGPRIIINCAMDDSTGMYKVTHNDTGNIGYYDKIYVFCGGDKDDIIIETPDWNAKQGEAGYIENKPFYGGNVIRTVGSGVIMSPKSFTINNYYRAKITTFRYYNSEGEYTDIDFDLKTDFASTIAGDGFELYVSYNINYLNATIEFVELTLNGGWIAFFVDEYDTLKALEDKYIPNTVLKTTSQALSDDDKNQALVNLGIDPVVIKYICNPYVYIYGGGLPLPSDLISIIADEFGTLCSIIFNVLLIQTFDENDDTIICHIKYINTSANSITLSNGTILHYSNGEFI